MIFAAKALRASGVIVLGLAVLSDGFAERRGRPETDPALDRSGPAVPDYEAIESKLAEMEGDDVRSDLEPSKSDRSLKIEKKPVDGLSDKEKADREEAEKKEKKAKKDALDRAMEVGRLSMGKPEKITKLWHNRHTDGVFMLAFEGPEMARLSLPLSKTRKGKAKTENPGKARSGQPDLLFYEFAFKGAVDSQGALSLLHVDGATLAFGYDDTLGPGRYMAVLALNGDYRNTRKSDWVDTGIRLPLDSNFAAVRAFDFMLRLDHSNGIWDLYCNNRLHYAGLFIGKKRSDLWVRSAGEGETSLYHLTASEENPLFVDFDRDGIPDDFELELGFSNQENDRHALDEMESFTSLQHFVNARIQFESPAGRELRAVLERAKELEEQGLDDSELAAYKMPAEQAQERAAALLADKERRTSADIGAAIDRSYRESRRVKDEDPLPLPEGGEE